MKQKIRKAAVLGAGVMGSGIAAHLANVGIPCFLLDIVPPEMTEAEKNKSLTYQSPEVRNRFAVLGKKRIQESRSQPPSIRRRMLYGKLKKHVGGVIREVCRQRGIELVEGHLMPDHIHMCVSIPPKHSVAFAIGFIKGKSAVRIHRQILGNKKVTGLHFSSRGTV